MTDEASAFRQTRFALYLAFAINGLIVQLVPFQFRCNVTGERCFACGLRTAVHLLFRGRFAAAYHSNKLIVVLVLAGAAMAADVLSYLYRRRKQRTAASA